MNDTTQIGEIEVITAETHNAVYWNNLFFFALRCNFHLVRPLYISHFPL